MPAGETPQDTIGDAWDSFAARHAGHPHLAHDPLYALPEGLIDQIRIWVPGLFSGDDEAFERDLARACRGGLFFGRRAVPCLLLERPVDERRGELDEQIRDAQIEHTNDHGVNKLRVDRFDERQARHEELADLRAAAYAGWLVANRQFLAERDDLRGREGSYVAANGGFPSLPRSYLGERSGASDLHEALFHLFYRRWNLDSFITWDLPLPLLPEVGVTTLDAPTLSGAGITVFLPWYVAEDGRFSPDELAGHLKALLRPDHLKGWLETPAGSRKALGDVGHRTYLLLYRYWGLVLMRRYGDRLGRRTMQLDRAFAKFLTRDEDTVKKIRIAVRRASEADHG